jgi:hypothetical protein
MANATALPPMAARTTVKIGENEHARVDSIFEL